MKSNYTHITVILDRSGSMEMIRDDIIGGFNVFLEEQKSEPDLATLTLVQFDTQDSYEVVHQFKKLEEVSKLTKKTFVPRSGTPLLDAVGRGINDLEQTLNNMQEEEQPSQVVMVIITDGQENSSREFSRHQIQKMIKEKQEEQDWQFVFLSADLGAIDDALHSGIAQESTMAFDKNAFGTISAFASMSSGIMRFRSQQTDNVSFTVEDRKKQKTEQNRTDLSNDEPDEDE